MEHPELPGLDATSFRPLQGVRIMSFTHFLQGPSASQLLAELGADVVKVEPPSGAFERTWSAPDAYLGGESVFFLLANRNVRSLAVNLRSTRALHAVRTLVNESDVLIESFRPGAMQRLGLGYQDLRSAHPGLVYCSLTGYGISGPYADRPGQDVLIQSMAGLAAATGRADDPPTPAAASLVDQHGAVLAAYAILAALMQRSRSGLGTRIDSSLLAAALDLQVEPLSYVANGMASRRSASGIASTMYKAPYGIYPTADDYLCLSLNSLPKLATVFEDDWFGSVDESAAFERRDEVNDRVLRHMRSRTRAEWSARFAASGVWFAPVHDYDDVLADPQVRHNEHLVEYEHPTAGTVTALAHPVAFDGARPQATTSPPALGNATQELLLEAGLTLEEIALLVSEGDAHVAA